MYIHLLLNYFDNPFVVKEEIVSMKKFVAILFYKFFYLHFDLYSSILSLI